MRQYPTEPTGRGQHIVQTAPSHCPAGHRLGPRAVLIRTLPCGCAAENGVGLHLLWECRECGAIIYDPPHINPEA